MRFTIERLENPKRRFGGLFRKHSKKNCGYPNKNKFVNLAASSDEYKPCSEKSFDLSTTVFTCQERDEEEESLSDILGPLDDDVLPEQAAPEATGAYVQLIIPETSKCSLGAISEAETIETVSDSEGFDPLDEPLVESHNQTKPAENVIHLQFQVDPFRKEGEQIELIELKEKEKQNDEEKGEEKEWIDDNKEIEAFKDNEETELDKENKRDEADETDSGRKRRGLLKKLQNALQQESGKDEEVECFVEEEVRDSLMRPRRPLLTRAAASVKKVIKSNKILPWRKQKTTEGPDEEDPVPPSSHEVPNYDIDESSRTETAQPRTKPIRNFFKKIYPSHWFHFVRLAKTQSLFTPDSGSGFSTSYSDSFGRSYSEDSSIIFMRSHSEESEYLFNCPADDFIDSWHDLLSLKCFRTSVD